MDKLKPCPFCGKPVRFSHNFELEPDGIVCDYCHIVLRYMRIRVKGGERFEIAMNKMAEAWSRRANEKS